MIIGLDFGTTNVKGLLETPEGEVLAAAAAPVSLRTGPNGIAEQDMAEIAEAACSVLAELGRRPEKSEVRAIGVSAQGGALQILDAQGRPIGAVVSWLDQRGAAEDAALTQRLGPAWFARHTGHPRARGAVGQILRLRRQGPGGLPPGCGVGFVGDVGVAGLCGVRAHDATSLSIAGLYNPRKRAADPDLLEILEIDPATLPRLLPARSVAGRLRPEIARRTGLPAGIPVLPAVHDQYAAAAGAGIFRNGDVMVGTGTAWVLLAAMDRLLPPAAGAAFVCTHLVEGMFGQMLAPGTGGAAFDAVRRLVGYGQAAPEAVDALLAAAPMGCEGLRCLPLFSGNPPPGLSGSGYGAFENIRLHHEQRHFLRAVLEGLACELARNLGLFESAGIRPERLVLCGGAAASRVTPQLIADVTGLPVLCLARPAMSAHGAAVLAQAVVEPGTTLEQISTRMAGPARRIAPGAESPAGVRLAAEYRDRLAGRAAADSAGPLPRRRTEPGES